MTTELAGKVVLVTGGARRIGRSIALKLAADGAKVLIHYHSSEAEALQVSNEAGGAPLFRADLEKVSEIQTMFRQIQNTVGRLDALVNNAARFTRFDPLELTEADWDFVHSVNLKAAFFCCQQAARIMRSGDGGRIVNISSLGGLRPWADHVHYCASKAGVIHMTRALAKALAPEISVNSVAPGVIPFAEKDDPQIHAFIRQTPAKRAGTGEEIAEAVAYFLTATKFITGQILAVDGGLSQR
jgi:NAD(P)-dependent dehydrogenase (short-subunit alcohol dehydrogenase family)